MLTIHDKPDCNRFCSRKTSPARHGRLHVFTLPVACFCIVQAIVLFFLLCSALAEGPVQARAAVEKQEVYQGESFLFQVQVEGDDAPQEPDLAAIRDFEVQPRGGQTNSSQSISIVNGRMERQVRHGYIFNYALTPRRTGRLSIPPITVTAGGQTLQTQAIAISVQEPVESEEFKLRLELAADSAYVGEAVPLALTWYISRDVKGFQFNLPLFEDPRFTVVPLTPEVSQAHADRFLKIPLGDSREAIAEKGTGQLDGRSFTTVRMRFVLLPKEAGGLTLPQGSVTCQVASGRGADRPNDPFGRFFQDDLMEDFFGRGRGGQLATVVAASNTPRLTVKPLPEAGRPAQFSGLVGEYSLHAEASPTEVNVGDPITLTVAVTGPEYLDNVTLPPLDTMPGFAEGFRIPAEMAPGERRGREKVFTQTIRAKDPAVTAVPAVSLAFFNPRTGAYETASAATTALTVRAAKVLTAEDAVGTSATPTAATRQKVTQLDRGIAHNYEDPSVLAVDIPRDAVWRITPLWWLLLLLPPGLFLVAGGAWWAARKRDPAAIRARRAYGELAAAVQGLENRSPAEAWSALAVALHAYLRARFALSPGALTVAEAVAQLRHRGVAETTLARLARILEACEAARYAGSPAVAGSDLRALSAETLAVAGELEK